MLTLIRGLPGSGKSRLAKELVRHTFELHFEADEFFVTDSGYKWDANSVGRAHDWCFARTKENLQIGERVIVSNTFTTIKEMLPYFLLTKQLNIPAPQVIICQGRFNSIHNVPLETIEKMRHRFVYNLSPLYEMIKT